MEVREEQPKKAKSAIEVKVDGRETEISEVQRAKTPKSILLTLEGMRIEVRDEHLLKA